MIRRRNLAALVALMLPIVPTTVALGEADGSSEGLELLRKSAEAMTRVQTARYRARFEPQGWVAPFFNVVLVEGTVTVGKWSKWNLQSFLCVTKLTPKDSTEVLELTAGSDGNTFFLLDPKARTVYVDLDPGVMGTHGPDLEQLIMTSFGSKEPLGAGFEPESAEMQGTESIGGVDCHKLVVKSKNGNEKEWHIGKSDYLPRRVADLYPSREDPKGAPGRSVLTLTDLEVNPKLTGTPFKPAVPVGFRKTDDFAP